MRLLVTGATGFLGWRTATCCASAGTRSWRLARPGGPQRARAAGLDAVELDAGDPRGRDLVAGCDAVLHFAGVPDPARAREDPARAVRENAGTTAQPARGLRRARRRPGLPVDAARRRSSRRPTRTRSRSASARTPAASTPRAATVVRLTSVFGPGQVAWEGATGAIARVRRRARSRAQPIVIPGDPERTRDFVYVDDVVRRRSSDRRATGRWNETVTLASGTARPRCAARPSSSVAAAEAPTSPIETPGRELPPGENESYAGSSRGGAGLPFDVRPLEEAVPLYVDWLRRHPAAQGRARG